MDLMHIHRQPSRLYILILNVVTLVPFLSLSLYGHTMPRQMLLINNNSLLILSLSLFLFSLHDPA